MTLLNLFSMSAHDKKTLSHGSSTVFVAALLLQISLSAQSRIEPLPPVIPTSAEECQQFNDEYQTYLNGLQSLSSKCFDRVRASGAPYRTVPGGRCCVQEWGNGCSSVIVGCTQEYEALDCKRGERTRQVQACYDKVAAYERYQKTKNDPSKEQKELDAAGKVAGKMADRAFKNSPEVVKKVQKEAMAQTLAVQKDALAQLDDALKNVGEASPSERATSGPFSQNQISPHRGKVERPLEEAVVGTWRQTGSQAKEQCNWDATEIRFDRSGEFHTVATRSDRACLRVGNISRLEYIGTWAVVGPSLVRADVIRSVSYHPQLGRMDKQEGWEEVSEITVEEAGISIQRKSGGYLNVLGHFSQ